MDDYDDDDESNDDLPSVTADAALSSFFARAQASAHGARRPRLIRAEADLSQCFEAASDRLLTTPELALRDFERQFAAEGAAARVAAADAMLFVLPVWLEEPRWHGQDLEDRRLRIQLTESLAETLKSLVGDGCATMDVESAVARARREIRSARRSSLLTRSIST